MFILLEVGIASGRIVRQSLFTTPHTASGLESFKLEEAGYLGALHLCDQEGEFKLTFDEFNRKEAPFEKEEK